MRPNLLILGGTTEARELAAQVAKLGIAATYSYAGRVARPERQPLPIRIGGFGGADGLAAYLTDNAVTHVVDATHPFAAQISANAVKATDVSGIPLLALTRAPWKKGEGDAWQTVPDITRAVDALAGQPRRVFLAIGRTEVAAFTGAPQHHYLLRFVDEPVDLPPLPNHQIIVARGPFDQASDRAVLQDHAIDLIVSKNSGGTGARAKLDAARDLGLPVLMIDRPQGPKRAEVNTVKAVIDWLAHPGTERGV